MGKRLCQSTSLALRDELRSVSLSGSKLTVRCIAVCYPFGIYLMSPFDRSRFPHDSEVGAMFSDFKSPQAVLVGLIIPHAMPSPQMMRVPSVIPMSELPQIIRVPHTA